MGFGQELKDFSRSYSSGISDWSRIEDIRNKRRWRESDLNKMDDPTQGGGGVPQTPAVEGGKTGEGGGGGGAGSEGGNAFAQQAYKHFRSKGLSHAAAAGIVGNLMHESGGAADVLSGYRLGDQGTAGYAAQWREQRLLNLKDFASKRGHGKPTIEDQLDFVMEEGNPQSPYANKGAVRAFELLKTARTAEEATKFFMDEFERPNPKLAHLDRRISHALRLQDTGGGAAAAAPAAGGGGSGTGGGELDAADSDEQASAIPADEGTETADAKMRRGSRDLQLELLPIPEMVAQAPQVQVDFTGDDELFAAHGGVIPEQHFQTGGTPVLDKYNPTRGYTQAIPQVAAGAAAPRANFTPRRIGDPVANKAATPAVSASQQAFRDMRAKQAVAPAPVAAAPAQTGGWEQAMGYQQQADALKNAAMTRTNVSGHRDTGGRPNTMAINAYNAYQRDFQAAQKAGQNPWLIDPSKYRTLAMQGRLEQGGMIPEPGESYARGGVVDPNRARAQQRGGVYEASRDHEYWQQRQPRPQTESARSAGYAPTSVAGSRPPGKSAKPAEPAKKGEPDKKKAKPDKEKKAKPDKKTAESIPVEEDRATRFKRHTIDDLYEDRATRERGGINDPRAGEMRERQPRAAAIPPLAQAAGTDVTGYEPKAQPAGTDVTGYEPKAQPAGTDVTGYEPKAQPAGTDVTGYEPPPGPIVGRPPPIPGRPRIPMPDTVLPEGSTATPPLPQQGPPAPPLPEQGVWIGGTFVPLAALMANPSVGMARGGVVPEEDEEPISLRAESAAYTTSAPASAATRGRPAPAATPTEEPASAPAAERPKADLQPTPKLMADVGTALKSGAGFLQRVFGMDGRGDGAVPTPESGAARQDGIKRFATHEGAATPEEIQQIDDTIDPKRELSEGDRQMTRLAKITQFYLERGRKREAEAAAAGLMQYGAKRFGQLGSLAQAAYSKYQQTGDRQHLEAATQFLGKAYQLIPDGGNMTITTNPETGEFEAVQTTADGEEVVHKVTADEIPGLIQQTMSGSAYWQQIFRLGDPQGARQQAGWQHEREVKLEERTYDERKEELKRQQEAADEARKRALDLEEEIAKEGRESTRKEKEDERKRVADEKEQLAKEKRSEERRARENADYEKRLRERWKDDPSKKGLDFDTISPLASAVHDSQVKIEEEYGKDAAEDYSDDDGYLALKAEQDRAASKLWDSLPATESRADTFEEITGAPFSDFRYYPDEEEAAPAAPAVPDEGSPAAPAAPDAAETPAPDSEPRPAISERAAKILAGRKAYIGKVPPASHPDATFSAEDGVWFYKKPDGKTVIVLATE